MIDFTPYNPLEKKNLAASVAEAMLEREPFPMSDLPRFKGAGIYAIYYKGTFPAYQKIADANKDALQVPIYVGKAVPPGGRTGGDGLEDTDHTALWSRLKEHTASIQAAMNLDLKDFACRFLVVDDAYISISERLLIAKFAPLWNKLVDGFGNHTPGKGRFEGARPRWDVLHPGRKWAAACKDRDETAEQIATEVAAYLRSSNLPTRPRLMSDN